MRHGRDCPHRGKFPRFFSRPPARTRFLTIPGPPPFLAHAVSKSTNFQLNPPRGQIYGLECLRQSIEPRMGRIHDLFRVFHSLASLFRALEAECELSWGCP